MLYIYIYNKVLSKRYYLDNNVLSRTFIDIIYPGSFKTVTQYFSYIEQFQNTHYTSI